MPVKRTAILLFSLLFITFIGCADDIVQNGKTVTVHLTDKSGFDFATYWGYPNISAGEYPIAIPDQNGRCSFRSGNFPYDIIIQNTYGGQVYKNITNTSPEIIDNADNYFHYNGYCRYSVNIPPPGPEQFALLRFISSDKFIEGSSFNIIWTGQGTHLRRYVKLPLGVNSISGKIVLMYFKGDYSIYDDGMYLRIDSFDSIAVKNADLSSLRSDTIDFTNQPMIKDLHGSHISYSTSYVNSIQFTEAYFSFPGYSPNSDIMFYSWDNYNQTLPVITDLPIPFEFKLKSSIRNNSSIIPQVIARGYAGDNFNLQYNMIQLKEPADSDSTVTDTTIFSFDDQKESGAYVVEIDGYIQYYTDKRQLAFEEMKNRIFSPEKGSFHFWRVYKITSFDNIDDLVSSHYYLSGKFKSIAYSEDRYFQVAK